MWGALVDNLGITTFAYRLVIREKDWTGGEDGLLTRICVPCRSWWVACLGRSIPSSKNLPHTHASKARLLSMCPDFPTGQFDAVGKKVGFFTGWQVFSYPYKNYAAHTATHKWVRSRSFRCRAVFDVLCLTASKNLDTAAPAAAAA